MEKKIDTSDGIMIINGCNECPHPLANMKSGNWWCTLGGKRSSLGEDKPDQVPQWCRLEDA